MENTEKMILTKLDSIEEMISSRKEILNMRELAKYTGYSESTLYKKVHYNKIPFSKPHGKMLFFERKKIDKWLLQNSSMSNSEISLEALKRVHSKK
ncbi:helix-turn-helix transcriptional regulator [Belliella pelovolcani]|uniref:helix-turn-helix transcriptional regulator n=1 Tax=Belliella pelovolcani TaxID=529505 RepID=UPI00391B9FA7